MKAWWGSANDLSGVSGEPSRDRTEDPLIKRREPVMSRLSVFLRSSAQARVAA
jgi:hypothetical protein